MPCCCWLFLTGIVGTPLQKIKQPIWQTTKHDPSGVKNKRVMKEDEEFSVWCDKNLSDDSLDEDDDEGDESQRGGGHVVDKISYQQLIHSFPLY